MTTKNNIMSALSVGANAVLPKSGRARVIAINVVIVIVMVAAIEGLSALGRIALGRPALPIFTAGTFDAQPCLRMKTHVLFSHVSDHGGGCEPLNGEVVDQFVFYDGLGDKKRVLTLGGSTTSGFYQHYSDGRTWPLQLHELLTDTDYGVVNGALGGYSSLQEMYKLISQAPRLNGDLAFVVSLNGINDLPNYQGANAARALEYPHLSQVQHMMNDRQIWVDQRLHPISFLPNTRSLLRKIMGAETKKTVDAGASVGPGSDEDVASDDDAPFRALNAADRWYANVRMMRAVAEEFGATYLVFLQPTMGLEGPQATPTADTPDAGIFKEQLGDANEYREAINALYEALRARCAALAYCYDISDVGPPTGDVYADARHHNAKGNALIAEKVRDVLAQHGLR
ncbi:MAG: SGNH/GDSL hydrolase family protein [Parvularculaceae bacterium]